MRGEKNAAPLFKYLTVDSKCHMTTGLCFIKCTYYVSTLSDPDKASAISKKVADTGASEKAISGAALRDRPSPSPVR